MKLNFWKKKAPKQQPREFTVPAENVRELLGYIDQKGAVATYDFWKTIEDLFPETTKGNWRLKRGGTQLCIIEMLES